MGRAGKIRKRLTNAQLEAMVDGCKAIGEAMQQEALDEIDALIREHIIVWLHRWQLQLLKNQYHNTLTMEAPEALAYYYMCQRWQAPVEHHTALVMQDVFTDIDKQKKR